MSARGAAVQATAGYTRRTGMAGMGMMGEARGMGRRLALAVAWRGRRATRAAVRRGGPGPRGAPLALLCLMLAALVACAGSSSGGVVRAVTPTPTVRLPRPAPPIRSTEEYRLAIVNARIARMTLDQELGQLFMASYLYPDPNHPDLQQLVTQMGAGGIILYRDFNIVSVPQMQRLTRALQAAAPIPLILGADEEGGGDDQTDQIFGPHPMAIEIGATGDPNVAAQAAARIAREMKVLGLNADFAPIVDVEAPSRAWTRAFGRSPDLVTRMGIAQVDAYQSRGIMATPKHFPGLGAADCNPHLCLPIITSSRAYLEQYDFAPYRALMSHHPAMIMTTDLLMPAIDPVMPAELSEPIVTGILRQEIGYDGVVITDALYMAGITKSFSIPEAAVLAILAGNDMLEGAWDVESMRVMEQALRAAVQSGRLTRARIDQSVRRILLLKLSYGLLPVPPSRGQRDSGLIVAAPASPGQPAGVAFGESQALVPDQRRLPLRATA
ncbi:MAG: hypothetical protein PVSMB4_10670 [Ktedonobacterales bacterium]